MTAASTGTIREHVRQVMAERGHTMGDAARAMGVHYDRLWNLMSETTLVVKEKYGRKLARYLGMEWYEVDRWLNRDAYVIRKARDAAHPSDDLVGPGQDVDTWMGTVAACTQVEPVWGGCDRCGVRADCRAAVAVGRPMPCELILEREVITPAMRFRLGRTPDVGTFAEVQR